MKETEANGRTFRVTLLLRPCVARGYRAATFDYDQYVGLMIDEAIEHNKRHPRTYTPEEAKTEIRKHVAEKATDHDL